MPSHKLTDRKLAELYYGLSKHYKELSEARRSPTEIYDELYNAVRFSLTSPFGGLYNLELDEHAKVYNVLNTFFYACPQFQQVPTAQRNRTFFSWSSEDRPAIVIVNYQAPVYYHRSDDFLFNWMLFNSLYQRPYYGHGWGWGSGWGQQGQKKDGSVLAALALIAFLAAAVVGSVIATYYLFSEMANSLERFWYSEGWLQAGVTMMGMAISSYASAVLCWNFATSPLFSLAVAAGVGNPVGIAVFGVACLTIIGAALGTLVINKIQQSMIKNANVESLDANDPHRYELTDKEARHLETIGIDPIKVKCAIVALRGEIGDEPANRLFSSRSTTLRNNLDLIRKLRRGDISEVNVGEMHFNCRQDPFVMAAPVAPEPAPEGVYTRPSRGFGGSSMFQPTAPSAPFVAQRPALPGEHEFDKGVKFGQPAYTEAAPVGGVSYDAAPYPAQPVYPTAPSL